MEQKSFPVFNFSEALMNLKVGHEIERRDIRLILDGSTIMMKVGKELLCPWLPTHKDILATDWSVIKVGK